MNKIVIFLVLVSIQAQAQKRFVLETGKLDFTSNAVLELISASTDKMVGVVDPANNQFAFIINIQSFKGFNSKLQQEHFNEKYMETDKFYQATFSGTLIDPIDYHKDGVYKTKAKGNLTIHGKKQSRIIPGTVTISKGQMTIESDFTVPLADHDIAIPKIVAKKIATEIFIKLKFFLKEKEGKVN